MAPHRRIFLKNINFFIRFPLIFFEKYNFLTWSPLIFFDKIQIASYIVFLIFGRKNAHDTLKTLPDMTYKNS